MSRLTLLGVAILAGSLLSAPVPKEKVKDGEAIVGEWGVVKYDTGGEKPSPPAEDLGKYRLTFAKDGSVVMTVPGGSERKMTYKLDPAAKVKVIDVAWGENESAGVYELDGDSLTIAYAEPGQQRPADITSGGNGVVVMAMKRLKGEKKDEPKEGPKKDR